MTVSTAGVRTGRMDEGAADRRKEAPAWGIHSGTSIVSVGRMSLQ